MKEMINEALKGYEELKEIVDENPEKAREKFLEVLENPMLKNFMSTGDIADQVKELDLPEEKEKFKELVDQMIEKVRV